LRVKLCIKPVPVLWNLEPVIEFVVISQSLMLVKLQRQKYRIDLWYTGVKAR
jgi:hypothetical protein